jgi:anti-sigma B factor antagonist
MDLYTRSRDNVLILELAGRFDTYTAPPVRQWLEEAATQEPTNVIVNLRGVSFLDSTGLATLVQGMKRCRQTSGDLLLCNLQQPVRLIFELTRLDKAFEIYPGEEEAIRAFAADGANRSQNVTGFSRKVSP